MDDFVKNLEKIVPSVDIIPFSASYLIKEPDVSATLKEVYLENIDGYGVSNKICKIGNSIFAGTECPFLAKDCDGITLFQYNGVNYLLFAELKSSTSFSSAEKAYEQLLGSMLKTLLVMRMLVRFKYLDFKFKALFISRKLSAEDRRIILLNARTKKSPKCNHILSLLEKKKLVLKKSDLETLFDPFVFEDLEFVYCEVPNGSEIYTINIINDVFGR